MREGILLEDALEEIEKRAKRIVDTNRLVIGVFCTSRCVRAWNGEGLTRRSLE